MAPFLRTLLMRHGLGAQHYGQRSLLDRGPLVAAIGFQESTPEVAPFPLGCQVSAP